MGPVVCGGNTVQRALVTMAGVRFFFLRCALRREVVDGERPAQTLRVT